MKKIFWCFWPQEEKQALTGKQKRSYANSNSNLGQADDHESTTTPKKTSSAPESDSDSPRTPIQQRYASNVLFETPDDASVRYNTSSSGYLTDQSTPGPKTPGNSYSSPDYKL